MRFPKKGVSFYSSFSWENPQLYSAPWSECTKSAKNVFVGELAISNYIQKICLDFITQQPSFVIQK